MPVRILTSRCLGRELGNHSPNQYAWNTCLFMSNTRDSCNVGHCAVSQLLNRTFGEQPIGSGCPVHWPARSPGLNPLDSLLRGHPKTLVYSAPIGDSVYVGCFKKRFPIVLRKHVHLGRTNYPSFNTLTFGIPLQSSCWNTLHYQWSHIEM
jgi:hypothetical protein